MFKSFLKTLMGKLIGCILAFIVIYMYDLTNGEGVSIKWDIFLAIIIIGVQSIVEMIIDKMREKDELNEKEK